MNNILNTDIVGNRIIEIRRSKVILDFDVAELYQVQTRDINKAVKNNPDKFPKGYIIELTDKEFHGLRWKNSTANLSKTRVLPKAFTEKGLYMLATILKGSRATKTTISIIETFAKLKNLTRNIKQLSQPIDEDIKSDLIQKSGKLLAEMLDDDLALSETETSVEFNLALLKFKHTIKRKKDKK
ncbi:MAG: ORF6N domain-containing protein [Bacteroidales bacterium]|jgi:phage regulator Rha-like protein|nr:ORF6N domain-containing protein [Bacteroidales bacterium]